MLLMPRLAPWPQPASPTKIKPMAIVILMIIAILTIMVIVTLMATITLIATVMIMASITATVIIVRIKADRRELVRGGPLKVSRPIDGGVWQ